MGILTWGSFLLYMRSLFNLRYILSWSLFNLRCILLWGSYFTMRSFFNLRCILLWGSYFTMRSFFNLRCILIWGSFLTWDHSLRWHICILPPGAFSKMMSLFKFSDIKSLFNTRLQCYTGYRAICTSALMYIRLHKDTQGYIRPHRVTYGYTRPQRIT